MVNLVRSARTVQVNILEAKTNFSQLLAAVAAGEEVIIANRGKPVARLVPMPTKPHRTTGFGALAGKMWVADDWDSPETNAAINQIMIDSANRFDPLIDPPKKKQSKRAPLKVATKRAKE